MMITGAGDAIPDARRGMNCQNEEKHALDTVPQRRVRQQRILLVV